MGPRQATPQPEVLLTSTPTHRYQPHDRVQLELEKGDQVVVETQDTVYTYELDGSPRDLTVKPTDTWVLDPVPGKRDAPTTSLITLTTCQDLFHSPDRSVAFGHLVKVTCKH